MQERKLPGGGGETCNRKEEIQQEAEEGRASLVGSTERRSLQSTPRLELTCSSSEVGDVESWLGGAEGTVCQGLRTGRSQMQQEVLKDEDPAHPSPPGQWVLGIVPAFFAALERTENPGALGNGMWDRQGAGERGGARQGKAWARGMGAKILRDQGSWDSTCPAG